MIACVSFVDVVAELERLGFREVAQTDKTVIFRTPGSRQFLIRKPNIHGYLPELLVDDAFDVAGFDPPRWTTFWGD